MSFDIENRRASLNWSDPDFRHYVLLVKIFSEGKIELQNLDIFTTGLKRLLELRRIHTLVFQKQPISNIKENICNN